MTKLQQWMTQRGKLDRDVARAVKRDRSQISRIRRGISAASLSTAQRLERLTGIKWWNFVEREARPNKG